MASPVHESIISSITQGFHNVNAGLPEPIGMRIATATNLRRTLFEGEYEGSSKTPDLAVDFADADGNLDPKFILEVGFSETYEQLVEEASLWLEGAPQVSVVLLIKFEESPPYRSPIHKLTDQELVELQFPRSVRTERGRFISHGAYGPISYNGLQWVGGFSTVFAEVWRLDSTSGHAAQTGDRVVG